MALDPTSTRLGYFPASPPAVLSFGAQALVAGAMTPERITRPPKTRRRARQHAPKCPNDERTDMLREAATTVIRSPAREQKVRESFREMSALVPPRIAVQG